MNAETMEAKKFTQSAPCHSCSASLVVLLPLAVPCPARPKARALLSLFRRQRGTLRSPCSCARTRPPPARLPPTRGRDPHRTSRARPRRLPTRGRVVRPCKAAPDRCAGSPRKPASRGLLHASCGSPACLLHLPIPSAGTLGSPHPAASDGTHPQQKKGRE